MLIREARPEDAAGIARVHVDSWRTTYIGLVPQAFLDSLSYDRREQAWTDMLVHPPHEGWFALVAEDDSGKIVGFAQAGPERTGDPVYRGELGALYLLKEHQSRGIGRRLTAAVAARLRQSGLDSMLLWVLASNPSRGFYEALGGEYLREQPITIGGATLVEVAYGWRDTRGLAAQL